MSRLIPSYIEQSLRIEVLERAVIASEHDYERMKVAAQAAYRAMVAMELSDGSKREWDTAVANLRAALAEPAIKDSLTVAEPVGWLHWLTVDGERFPQLTLMPRTDKDEPLYTAPPAAQPAQERMHPEIKKMYEDYFDKCFRESSAQQRPWAGLTDEEITEIRLKMFDAFATNYEAYRAIETKLREKNT